MDVVGMDHQHLFEAEGSQPYIPGSAVLDQTPRGLITQPAGGEDRGPQALASGSQNQGCWQVGSPTACCTQWDRRFHPACPVRLLKTGPQTFSCEPEASSKSLDVRSASLHPDFPFPSHLPPLPALPSSSPSPLLRKLSPGPWAVFKSF